MNAIMHAVDSAAIEQAVVSRAGGGMVVALRMQQLALYCGHRQFRPDEELFLSIYTVWLFKERNLAALTWKQGVQINRLWKQYCE